MADTTKHTTLNPRSLPSAYSKAMEVFTQSGQFSDLRLTCKGHEFPVHRVIVCSHSPVLMAACEENFLEARTQSIALDEDDLATLRRLISYMYTFDYPDHESTNPVDTAESTSSYDDQSSKSRDDQPNSKSEVKNKADRGELFSSVRVYAIADEYDVFGLKKLARARFEAWAKVHWMSEHFPAMVSEVLETTPTGDNGLQDICVSVFVKNMALLVSNPAWQNMIGEHGQFGAKLLAKVVGQSIATEQKLQSSVTALTLRVDQLKEAGSADGLDLLVQRVNQNYNCRHCGISMNVLIEFAELTIPRCRGCRTRHF